MTSSPQQNRARSWLAGATLLVATASTPVHAQNSVPKLDLEGRRGDVARLAKQRALERFELADTNGDGKLSREEVEMSLPYFATTFAEHDKNGDGFLSWEEYIGHDRWPR